MGVTVGACRITLRLPENQSLKGKRQVIKSLISRLQNRFNVSVAEVDDNDSWQIATIGVACVSNSERHANETLQNVLEFVRRERLDAELVDVTTEIVHGIAE
jgi:uncharacterized protein YlxP (DUF503 family)